MKNYQDFKKDLAEDKTTDLVNKTTKKEITGSTESSKKSTDTSSKNASTIKTKGTADESKKVNSITKTNAKESYQNFKADLTEAKDRLTKSAEICDAIMAQTDNKEIITMAKGIKADIAKGELTPKQSEWIFKTSTSMKK